MIRRTIPILLVLSFSAGARAQDRPADLILVGAR